MVWCPGLARDYLDGEVPSEQVDAFHGPYHYFHINGILWQLTTEICVKEVALRDQYTSHLENYLYCLIQFLDCWK